jgi:creatinine amidohydrolase
VAERVGGIVAPLAYGYKSQPFSGGGQSFTGTTSLDGITLTYLVRDLLHEFMRHGAKRMVLIDGRYENASFLTEGISLALRDKGDPETRILFIHWWELIKPETLDRVFGGKFPGCVREHAAVLETSAIAHLEPDLVLWDRLTDDTAGDIPPYAVYPPTPRIVPKSGVLSPARLASREVGEALISEAIEGIVRSTCPEYGMKESGCK